MSQQLAQPRKNFLALVEGQGFTKQLAMALPKHVTPERVLRIVLTQMNKIPKLYDCDQQSVLGCIMDASALGLEIDGKKAAMVPFNDKRRGLVAQLIVGYQGYIELGYRHPLVTGIRAKAVYEKDFFDYDEGLHPRLEHRPYQGDDDPGELRHAYAICNIGEKGSTFVVIGKREIKRAMKASARSGYDDSPWQQHPEAMWVKTAVLRLAKFMPKSSELAMALSLDAESNGAMAEAMTIPAATLGAGSQITPLDAPAAAEKMAKAATRKKEAPPSDEPPMEERQEPYQEGGDEQPAEPEPAGPTKPELIKQIQSRLVALNMGKSLLNKALVDLEILASGEDYQVSASPETLLCVVERWDEIIERVKNA